MKKNNIIKLSDFQTHGAKVFTGRDRGAEVRSKSEIDFLEEVSDKIIITIPENIYSINPSFLEEFLVNVVIKLGKITFQEKIQFESEGEYQIDEDLLEAIDRILRKKNALHYNIDN